MVQAAGVPQAARVLELGPGTGAITGVIHEHLPETAKFVGVELNAEFVKQLRVRFPHSTILEGGAQEVDLQPHVEGSAGFDAIISGLPWTAFPRSLQEDILGQVLPQLAPGGCFVTFAYWGLHRLPGGQRFRALLCDHAAEVTTTPVVWGNLPPAFVYVARKSA